MATVMDLVQWYKAILESVGLQIDENGNTSMMLGEQAFPCTVNEKRLVLPLPELLRSGAGWDQRVAFHPLSENVVRAGESPVLKKFRALANHRLTEVISTLMTELMEIAADPSRHAQLTPRQSEFLSHVKDADAKTLKGLIKVLESVSTTGPRRIVSTYLKKGGKLRGQSYSRVAVVSFPIVEEIDLEAKTIFNVTLDRKKDVQTIVALFNYIIPNAHDLEEYSYGSNSRVAPYFHALCHAYINVAKRLNTVTRRFRKHLDNPDGMLINLDWEDQLDEMDKFRDLIPSQPGNNGGDGEEEAVERSAQAGPRQAASAAAALREKYAKEVVNTTTTSPECAAEARVEPAQAGAQREGPATAGEAVGRSSSGVMDWNELVAKSPVLSRTMAPFAPFGQQQQPFPQTMGYRPQPGFQQPPVHGFVQQPAAQEDWRSQWRRQPTRGGYGASAPTAQQPFSFQQNQNWWPSSGGGFGGGRV